MKIRLALALVGLSVLGLWIGTSSWTKASAQTATMEIRFVGAGAKVDLASGPITTQQSSGTGHWLNTARQCQVEQWVAPQGLFPCKSIAIGGRPYHIVAATATIIYVE